MAGIFTSLTCSVRYDNARVLTWTMKPGADYPADLRIDVECSRAGGEWEVLAEGLHDTCSYVDNRRRNYNKRLNECYRLRAYSETTGESCRSDIADAGNYRAYPFSKEAENVIKMAHAAIKQSGCTGKLLKKKLWGSRCPDCTDFDGEQTVNEHCRRCLGTGIDGGYFPGIPLSIVKDRIETGEAVAELGYVQKQTVTGRCIAYPWICYGDVWVEDGTNRRYMITGVAPSSSYKQTTLLYTLSMTLLELSDVLHSDAADMLVRSEDKWQSAFEDASRPEDTIEKSGPTDWDKELGDIW